MRPRVAEHPQLDPHREAAVARWMRSHGWNVLPAWWQMEPEAGFFVWQEETPSQGRSHALWVSDSMVASLAAEQLVEVLNREGLADEIRINFKVRIEERGAEYRVSVVPRRSGEFRTPD